jgi:ZIP family zinc transporter
MSSIEEFFRGISPVLQAFIAACFTWSMAAFGAASVFVVRSISHKLLGGVLGFAGGVMIAVSFWSLLAPSIELAADSSVPAWLPATVGFLAGGLFLRVIDKLLPHLHRGMPTEVEGIKTSWRRNTLFIMAMTLHHIPEGLAVGVAFGAAAGATTTGLSHPTLAAAIVLAIGMGIQNFPEGLAVSVPLRGDGMSRPKSFWFGQLSAVVEPVAAVIGAASVIFSTAILPYALAFAAGAMIFIVIEEIIPQSQRYGNKDLVSLTTMAGFVIMMILVVAFS